MTPLTKKDPQLLLLRSQKQFVALVGIFIVISSFAYGFVKGSSQFAQASAPTLTPRPVAFHKLPAVIKGLLPSDAKVALMGHEMTVNGVPAEMVSFTLDRNLQSFVFEQRTLWKYRGFDAKQQSSDRRAISFAINRQNGMRASLVVWAVPEAVRNAVSNGHSLQGTLSLLYPGSENKFLPGIPTMPGSVFGSVVASNDLGRRSYTASFNNPGLTVESQEFYDSYLLANGWNRLNSTDLGLIEGQRIYRKNANEVTLIFAPVPEQLGTSGAVSDRTMVTAILSTPLVGAKL